MKSLALSASPRTQTRRKGARKIRSGGRIPAIIYGRHNPPQNLEIDAKQFDELVHKAHTEIILVDLTVEGDAKPARLALVQDVQHHPLSGHILHVDLHEVKADEKVSIEVPVEAVGIPDGVKNGGGTLEHVRFRVRVRCLPKDLPEQINVDVTNLKVGETLHIGEIVAPEGVELLGDKKIPVLAVAAPVAEAAAETTAAPAAGEAAKPRDDQGEEGRAGCREEEVAVLQGAP